MLFESALAPTPSTLVRSFQSVPDRSRPKVAKAMTGGRQKSLRVKLMATASVLAIGLAAPLLVTNGARAQVWTGAISTDWNTAGNWTPTGVPNSSSTPIINNGSIANPVVISSAGAQGGILDIASISGSVGALSVVGPGTLTTTGPGGYTNDLTVGDFGTGALTISNGATVTSVLGVLANNAGSNGAVTIAGAGSQWTVTSLYATADNATSSLTVSSGGKLSAGLLDMTDFVSGGTSVVTATGAGSNITVTGGLLVGTLGTGTFNVASGATAHISGGLSVGTSTGTGFFNVSSGGVINSDFSVIGSTSGGAGAATVTDSGSTWNISPAGTTALLINAGQAASSLTVQNGAAVLVTSAGGANVEVGGVATSNGSIASLTVTGSGSTFTANLPVGLYVGAVNGADGSLTVSNGGQLTSWQSFIGYSISGTGGGTGQALVTGAGSQWTVNGADLVIGAYGSGSLTIANGGEVSTTAYLRLGNPGSSTSSTSATLNIGAASGSAPTAAGTLSAPYVSFEATSGLSAINFNHTSSNYLFSSIIKGTGTGEINALAGTTILTADSRGALGTSLNVTTTISPGATLQLGNGGATGSLATNIVDNGALVIDHSSSFIAAAYPFKTVLSGSGSLVLAGGGDFYISADSSGFAGSVLIHSGNLRLNNDAAGIGKLGSSSGDIGVSAGDSGAVLLGTLWNVGSGQIIVGDAGSGILDAREPSGAVAVTSGSAILANQSGSTGGVVLAGPGVTWTNAGAFVVGEAGTGKLSISAGALLSDASAIIGDANGSVGAAEVTGPGTWSTTGTITIANHAGSTGSLAIGTASGYPAAAPGALNAAGVVFGAGTGSLDFNHTSTNYIFATPVSGSGTVNVLAGTTHLTGASTYTGATNVNGGKLFVDGSLGNTAVSVASGALLGGSGSIAGSVNVASGATLIGVAGQTLGLGSLVLNSGSIVNVALGAPSTNTLFNVTGNLTLGGTLNATDSGGFGLGVYRLFNYGGGLTDNGLAVGILPTADYGQIQTSIANQVNLVVTSGPAPTIQFWNGVTTSPTGTIVGGAGTWTAGPPTNWTDSAGATSRAWSGVFAVFQPPSESTSGSAVTVDGGAGSVTTTGMQFIGTGWTVTGDPIALNGAGGQTTIRVGDGTTAGAAYSATIGSALTGATNGLVKTDIGTLTLAGVNSYAGATIVNAGTLALGPENALNAVSATSVNTGGALDLGVNNQTINSVTLNGGTLTQQFVNTNQGQFGTLTGNLTSNGGTIEAFLIGSSTLTVNGGTTIVQMSQVALGCNCALGDRNNYTGATTINAGGVLKPTAWDYILSGSSAFTINSGGTLDLNATNQAVGSIAGSGLITSSTGSAASPTFLRVNNTSTFAGQITGPIRIQLADFKAMTLTLTGTNNTFSGGVVWGNNGYNQTLVATNAGSLGTGELDMFPRATLEFTGGAAYSVVNNIVFQTAEDPTIQVDPGTSVTLAGVISGAGALAKTGAGTLILANANTYSGDTYLDVGTLGVANNGALSSGTLHMQIGTTLQFEVNGLNIPNNIVLNDAVPTIDTQSFTATLSGVISGAGDLTKIGSGTLIMTNTNTYTGPTDVQVGALAVTGSIVSTATVESGAAIGGSGTIGALIVNSGGTVAPGVLTPFSTLTANGTGSFAAGSFFAININPAGQNDKLVTTGATTISGGTVAVTPAAGTFTPANKYTIVTANGGVTGTFGSVTGLSSLAFLTPVLSYDAQDVYLGFQQKDVTPVPPGPGPTPPPKPLFATVAVTPNQIATATALSAQPAGSPLYNAIIGQTAPGARAAFDALSGEIHASAVSNAFNDSRLPREAILDRLSDPFGAPPSSSAGFLASAEPIKDALSGNVLTTWGQAFGSSGHTTGDGNAASFNSTLGGFIFGADESIDGHYRLGVAGGYTQSSLSAAARGSAGTVYSTFGGLYGGASFNALQLRAGALYAYNRFETNRVAVFPGFAGNLDSAYGGNTAQGFVEAGWRVPVHYFPGLSYVEPFVGGAVVAIDSASFAETGGVAALNGQSSHYDYGLTTLGLRGEAGLTDSLPLVARGLLAWRHVFGDVTPNSALAFASAPSSLFTVSGAPAYRDALMIEAGLDWRLSGQVSLGVYYSAALSAQGSENTIKGRFEARF